MKGLKRWFYRFVPTILTVFSLLSKEIQCNVQFPYQKWNKQANLQAPGPWILPSHGKIWPKPQLQTDESEIFFTLNSTSFSFKVSLN